MIGQALDPLHPLACAERLAAIIPAARFEKITPKAESRDRYVADFRTALRAFLTDNCEVGWLRTEAPKSVALTRQNAAAYHRPIFEA